MLKTDRGNKQKEKDNVNYIYGNNGNSNILHAS